MNWRSTRLYRLWRAKVIRKWKRCQVCGTIKHRHAHHVNHSTYFPEQRFEEVNGIVLCKNCHKAYHCDYHHSYREKCTRKSLREFFKLVEYIKTIGEKK